MLNVLWFRFLPKFIELENILKKISLIFIYLNEIEYLVSLQHSELITPINSLIFLFISLSVRTHVCIHMFLHVSFGSTDLIFQLNAPLKNCPYLFRKRREKCEQNWMFMNILLLLLLYDIYIYIYAVKRLIEKNVLLLVEAFVLPNGQ